MAYGLNQIQLAFEGLLSNMGILYKPILLLAKLSPFSVPPSDKLNSQLANSLQQLGDQRERLTKDTFISSNPEDGLARLENAFQAIVKTAPIAKKLSMAIKSNTLPKKPINFLIEMAYEKNVIDAAEKELLKDAEAKRLDAIQVDSFDKEGYFSTAA